MESKLFPLVEDMDGNRAQRVIVDFDEDDCVANANDTVQNVLVKALNADNINAVAIEGHPYSTKSNRTDILCRDAR